MIGAGGHQQGFVHLWVAPSIHPPQVYFLLEPPRAPPSSAVCPRKAFIFDTHEMHLNYGRRKLEPKKVGFMVGSVRPNYSKLISLEN